ncbi:MAG: hypothetical protein D6790_03505 [Caldilineae bacterium]|nr:MAG: hypothetical protein D6790_03505 [Caldilineae bacterium]
MVLPGAGGARLSGRGKRRRSDGTGGLLRHGRAMRESGMRMREGRPAYDGPGHHGQHRKDQGRGHVAHAPPAADS